MKRILAASAVAALAACATSDAGWTGEGATPFDTAYAECAEQTAGEGAPAFEACMAGHGWTRSQD